MEPLAVARGTLGFRGTLVENHWRIAKSEPHNVIHTYLFHEPKTYAMLSTHYYWTGSRVVWRIYIITVADLGFNQGGNIPLHFPFPLPFLLFLPLSFLSPFPFYFRISLEVRPLDPARAVWEAPWAPPAGSEAEPHPKSNLVHFSLKI